MKINFEQLSNQLLQNHFPVYLVSGDETLFVDEACQIIRERAKFLEFTEREIWYVDRSFDWTTLKTSANSLSLFSEKTLIEVRLASSKINDAGKKALLEYLSNPPTDKLLLLVTGKIDGTTQNTKWFKSLEKTGAFIPIWPLTTQQLPYWIQKQLRHFQINADNIAIKCIADHVEGNLLAAKQEIEKLGLLFFQKNISAEDVIWAMSDNARYDIFSLTDSILLGDIKRTLRILTGLKDDGTEPTLILWALTREIRNLLSMVKQRESGLSVDDILFKNHIWEKRKPIIRNALNHLSMKHLFYFLKQASKIDLMIKGIQPGSVWTTLNQLSLSFAKNNRNQL